MKQRIVDFIKKETVLVVAAILAVISAFFVKPNIGYMEYIDWRVLGILLSLMLVMAGFQKNGFFAFIGQKLLNRTSNTVQLSLVLVFLCFFFSMLITNDVALLTFVPFAMLTLKQSGEERLLIPVIVLQTLAANLGSMLTPIGNPQNLYLYNLAGMSIGEFIMCMLPYTVASGVLILMGVLLFTRQKNQRNEKRKTQEDIITERKNKELQDEKQMKEILLSSGEKKKNTIYMVLFFVSLLVVGRILPFYIALIVILIVMTIIDRDVLPKVDYCLLLTFIAFFIFTGNMGNMPAMEQALQNMVSGRELLVGILASQVISNVPAALLLSGFTTDYRALLEGVNIGGLGTLIASMASLISYKIYAHNYNDTKGKYFLLFTLANIAILIVLAGMAIIL